MGEHLAQSLRQSSINVHEGRKAAEIKGDDRVEGLVPDDGTELDINGIFIELGAKAAAGLAGMEAAAYARK